MHIWWNHVWDISDIDFYKSRNSALSEFANLCIFRIEKVWIRHYMMSWVMPRDSVNSRNTQNLMILGQRSDILGVKGSKLCQKWGFLPTLFLGFWGEKPEIRPFSPLLCAQNEFFGEIWLPIKLYFPDFRDNRWISQKRRRNEQNLVW